MMGSMDKNLKKKEGTTQLPSVPSTVIVDLGGGWVGGGLCGRACTPAEGGGIRTSGAVNTGQTL